MSSLPLVSIITPSYNHERFIKQTIESILMQDYPNIEHIVVDGGSTDGTLSILQSYARLGNRFRFVSEKDRGQSHAINKGLAMAKGEIIGWLNSDDTYQPGAVRKAVHALQQHTECGMVQGKCYTINEHSHVTSALQATPADYSKLYHGCVICQPAAFIRKSIFEQVGGVDEGLNFCMDYDLWIRIAKHHSIAYVDDFLANARIHGTSKTSTQWHTVGIPEVLLTVEKHYGSISNTWLRYAPHYRKRPPQSPSIQTGQSNVAKQAVPAHVLPVSFGHPERIASMNRHNDLSVPPLFRITTQAVSDNLLSSLLIKGRAQANQAAFPCNVLLNGRSIGSFWVTPPSFIWEIPLDTNSPVNQVDILSSKFLRDPAGTNRIISYFVDEVLPLTAVEAAHYKRSQNFFKR